MFSLRFPLVQILVDGAEGDFPYCKDQSKDRQGGDGAEGDRDGETSENGLDGPEGTIVGLHVTSEHLENRLKGR